MKNKGTFEVTQPTNIPPDPCVTPQPRPPPIPFRSAGYEPGARPPPRPISTPCVHYKQSEPINAKKEKDKMFTKPLCWRCDCIRVRGYADKSMSVGQRLVYCLHNNIVALSHKWFTHVLLILLCIGYCALGAVIFQIIEGAAEDERQIALKNEQHQVLHKLYKIQKRYVSKSQFKADAVKVLHPVDDFLDRLWNISHESEERWREGALIDLEDLEQYIGRLTSDADERVWNFWGSMFYCGTIITTIGR